MHCGIWQNELFVEYIWKGSSENQHIPFHWNSLFLCGGAVGGIEQEESFCQGNQTSGPFRDSIGSF